MNATILLQGYLTTEKLREAAREMARYRQLYENDSNEPRGELSLVIASEGAVATEALALSDDMKSLFFTTAKIYRAESAAALIALAAEKREMVRNGIFTISLGMAEVDSGTLITPEKVSDQVIEQAKQFRNKVFERLEHLGFPKTGPLMNKLLTQNQLSLTADECLKLGVVERII